MSALKSILVLATLIVANISVAAQSKVLLIEASRYTYNSNENSTEADKSEKERYKVVLNEEFLSQFAKMSEYGRSDKTIYCNFYADRMIYGRFFSVLANGQIVTWGWGQGAQKVQNKDIVAMNGIVTSSAKFSGWGAISFSDSSSFVNEYAGVNLGFSFEVVDETSPEATKAYTAKITVSGGSDLVVGDKIDNVELKVSCGIQ